MLDDLRLLASLDQCLMEMELSFVRWCEKFKMELNLSKCTVTELNCCFTSEFSIDFRGGTYNSVLVPYHMLNLTRMFIIPSLSHILRFRDSNKLLLDFLDTALRD
ncbi:hypothetical protein MXB_681 [Myxobolus squamalis]|nr:hypothetical protein MXB_681 [Myxobolus squamalis]